MKKSLSLSFALAMLMFGSALAGASTLISKQQATRDAQVAVGGGEVIQAVKEKERGKIIWSVDVTGPANEFEVWVDAHNGSILQVITQPRDSAAGFITQQQAEQAATSAGGDDTVVQAQREHWKGYEIWDLTIDKPEFQYEVFVNAKNAAILKVTKLSTSVQAKFISKSRAEQIALNAVGGGKVLLIRLEKNDHPVIWSVDVKAKNRHEYEVKVNAVTGKVTAIIVGG